MSIKYSEKEISFLKENYSKYGPKYCAKILNKNPDAVSSKAIKLGLKKIGRDKHPSMQKINPEQFYSIITPEVAYFLGYFWADGNIIYRLNKTCNYYGIRLEIQSEDAKNILPILNKIGTWAIGTRKRNINWKETTMITTNSKDLYNFLKQHDYDSKSYSEPTKILSKIPHELKPYWWHGYFDGDGTLYLKNRTRRFEFSSTYNYLWIEIINLLKSLNINVYHIYNGIHKTKNHKYSKFFIYKKDDISVIIKYLLLSEYGLKRKTDKFNEYLKSIENSQ